MKISKNETQIIKKTAKDTICSAIDGIGSALLGPLWEVKNALQTCYGGFKELSFNEYLKSLYKQLENNVLTEADIEEYIEEIKKESSNQYISNILDSLFFSKCILSSRILGFISAKYLYEHKLDYCDLVLVSAVKDLYDNELETFYQLFTAKNNAPWDGGIIVYSEEDHIILEKLQHLNIYGQDKKQGRLSNVGFHDPVFFEITSVSRQLAKYYELLTEQVG